MPTKLIRYLMAFVAFGLLIGFIALYSYAIYEGGKYEPTKPYEYVSTSLAGLVGAVVAMVFNQKLQDNGGGGGGVKTQSFDSVSRAVKQAVAPTGDPDPLFAGLSAGYVIGYFGVAIASIVAWVIADKVNNLISNLALISLGLFVAIARSFFNIPKPS